MVLAQLDAQSGTRPLELMGLNVPTLQKPKCCTKGYLHLAALQGWDPPPAPPRPGVATHTVAFKEAGASELSEFATTKSCTSSLECPQGQQQQPGGSIQAGAGSTPPSPQLSAYHAGQSAG